ncbi:hypothetical protein Egran_01063 [Elaphomyces granulatus]|uniref:Conserved oligomeric Golgi complex subunit 8 n=1 Tax=Elaphomyces granulatus TaxID=519963 RepID=A0A232M436_9EURO|nr:hypothetical protein Egran_01063 [Elaphomyces granulatus]
MADTLYELLAPSLETTGAISELHPPTLDSTTSKYLTRLSTLSLDSLKSTEPQSIAQSSHLTLLSLQSLSNRSHKAFITSSDNLSTLQTSIPRFARQVRQLQDAIPALDGETIRFTSTYSKVVENPILDRRKKAMQLARNVDRLSDILELPTLLSTAVFSSSLSSGTPGASTANCSSALDLYAHIKRLQTLYPTSPLIQEIVLQAESAMKDMTTNLIAGLRTQNVRLAAAIRTIGWLQRVAPELEIPRRDGGAASNEGAFGGLFLVCRLANLVSMLGALDPLRELADQETQRRNQNTDKERRSSASAINAIKWSEGHQSERFLKRFIEIYREQSFAIVSLYKNIFASEPSDSTTSMQSLDLRQMGLRTKMPQASRHDPLRVLPPAMATFPMHLVQLLTDTLRTYLPNVQDRSSRESLLTQVLYCAASLGRLGGDFSMILTQFGESSDDEDNEGESPYEWEVVMKKHRDLAGRLEQLTSGTAVPGSDGASRAAPPVWG